MELSGPGGAGGSETCLASLADFGAPGSEGGARSAAAGVRANMNYVNYFVVQTPESFEVVFHRSGQ